MSDPLGLSIGTTNLVAARVGNQPVIRRSVVTLFGHAAPEVGMPSANRRHRAERLRRTGRRPGAAGGAGRVHRITPTGCWSTRWGRWSTRAAASRRPRSRSRCRPTGERSTLRVPAQRTACRADLAPNGTPARLVSDAVASLTALHANPGLCRAGRGGAAGFRRRAAPASRWRTRRGIRADRRDHSLHRVLRRPDRPGAAGPHRGRHRQRGRYRSGRHRRGRFAHPAARGVP